MLDKVLKDFPHQLEWEPHVEGELPSADSYIVAGMGGSHLAADLLLACDPDAPIKVHSDYGLPHGIKKEGTCVIASSYSGNTEETIDSYLRARESGIAVVAVSTGGELLKMAAKDGVPYITLPDTGIQPRHALGFSLKAIAHAARLEKISQDATHAAAVLGRMPLANFGRDLAFDLGGRIPVLYSSARNKAAAHIAKIKFNETGKIPAFSNVFPEANHNEMTGFDFVPATRAIVADFHAVFIRDDQDDDRVAKRFDACSSLFQKKGIPVAQIEMKGSTRLERLLSVILAADWASYDIAIANHADPEGVPMVEDFKKALK